MRISLTRLRVVFALLPLFIGVPAAADNSQQVQPIQVEALLLDGSRYSLAENRSAVTVLSVFSPESLASRKCIWELQRFASAYETRGVETLAISTTQDADELRQFVKKRKLSLPVGMLGNNNLGKIDEIRMPLVYVFDRDGKLQVTHSGLFSYGVLERLVSPHVSR